MSRIKSNDKMRYGRKGPPAADRLGDSTLNTVVVGVLPGAGSSGQVKAWTNGFTKFGGRLDMIEDASKKSSSADMRGLAALTGSASVKANGRPFMSAMSTEQRAKKRKGEQAASSDPNSEKKKNKAGLTHEAAGDNDVGSAMDSFLKKYTHLVVGKNTSIAAAMKLLGLQEDQELSKGLVFVQSDWLIECLKQKKRVSEDQYTVKLTEEPRKTTATTTALPTTPKKAYAVAVRATTATTGSTTSSPAGMARGRGNNDGGGDGDGLDESGNAGQDSLPTGDSLTTGEDSLSNKEGGGSDGSQVSNDDDDEDDVSSDDGSGNEGSGRTVSLPPYLCQRRCPLKHHNMKLTAQLDELISLYKALPGEENQNRALSFGKATNILRAMPFKCTSSRQIAHVHGISKKTLGMIDEFLSSGKISRLEAMRKNKVAVACKELTQVYGVGTGLASRWANRGIKTVADAKAALERNDLPGANEMIRFGLEYYDDFTNHLLNREQAAAIGQLVKQTLEEVVKEQGDRLKDAEIRFEVVGGYRRGKGKMHDVDMVATVRLPDGGDGTPGLLDKIAFKLETMSPPFLIHRFTGGAGAFGMQKRSESVFHANPHQVLLGVCSVDGLAKRCDIILCPPSQYAFCVLGWSGNTMFERSLRSYTREQKEVRFSSQGMSHGTRRESGAVVGPPVEGCLEGKFDTEEKIFDYLGLEYIPPGLRNC